jgi:hypothetical protein
MIAKRKKILHQAESWPEADQRELANYAEELSAVREGREYQPTDEELAAAFISASVATPLLSASSIGISGMTWIRASRNARCTAREISDPIDYLNDSCFDRGCYDVAEAEAIRANFFEIGQRPAAVFNVHPRRNARKARYPYLIFTAHLQNTCGYFISATRRADRGADEPPHTFHQRPFGYQ